MKFFTKLAFKNLFRHKIRTIVSIIAIAFSVLIVVFARGFISGMINSFSDNHIQYNSGHIKIVDQNYYQQQRLLPLNYPVDGFNREGVTEMISSLEELEDIEMVIPRLKFGAMVSTGKEIITMLGWGVNPEKEIEFTNIEDLLVEGRMVKPSEMEIMMGTELLNKLDYNVGDKITILYTTAFNSLKGVTFKIVGRVESGIKSLNEMIFYLPLNQAQRLLYMEDQSTELLLVLPDKNMTKQVLPEVKELLKNKATNGKYLALDYKETSDIVPYMELAKVIYNFIYIFLVSLASIVVINTMIMIVKERTKEIGMMSALGIESRGILQLFIIEGTIMGVFGSLIGSISGFFVSDYLAKTGINMSSAVSGFSSEIIFNSYIYPVTSAGNTIFAFILGVIVVTIACIIPARQAAKLEPTEAMKVE